MTDPRTRAEARSLSSPTKGIPADVEPVAPAFQELPAPPAYAELVYEPEPTILPLWARRTFYVIGTLAGAGALIVGGYDAELAKNIAGAGAILVASLALANPTR